jgi:HEAT repeat protein
VHRDIAFALACIATFAMAIASVAYSGRSRGERQGSRIALLEAQVHSLQERFSALAQVVGSGAGLDSTRAGDPARSGGSASRTATEIERAAATRPPVSSPASSSSGAVAVALRDMAPENPPELRRSAARELLQISSDQLRLDAARTLLEVDPNEGLAAVTRLIASNKGRADSARTAMAALSLLGEIASAEADTALRGYTQDRSALVRVQAAKVLGQRGDPAPLAQIAETLTRELASPDHRRRIESLALLGVAAQPSSIPGILPLLRDPSSEIRKRAIRALGAFQDASLASALTPLLRDPVPEVRLSASQALRRIR